MIQKNQLLTLDCLRLGSEWEEGALALYELWLLQQGDRALAEGL